MKEIYYIGGSPCSGKSTVAEILAKKYDMFYFKVDEKLDEYIEEAAKVNKEICSKIKGMTPEEIWMREPELQCREEQQIYTEIFDFVLKDMENVCDERSIVTEEQRFCRT